jgi:hypothetical protein
MAFGLLSHLPDIYAHLARLALHLPVLGMSSVCTIGSGIWTHAQIAAERRRDLVTKAKFHGTPNPQVIVPEKAVTPALPHPLKQLEKPLGKLTRLWR